nr:uncharacterized protein LOC109428565 [Aedes albopictus]
MITKEQLNQILTDNHYITISTAAVDVVVEDVNQMNCSDNERAMFLAHMIHESFGFTRWVEKNGPEMNYTPHYGRGYIYLTYRRNYRAYSRAIFGNPQELDENPDRVCESEKNDDARFDVGLGELSPPQWRSFEKQLLSDNQGDQRRKRACRQLRVIKEV